MRRRVPKKLSASKWSFTARVTTIFPEKIFGENVTAECKFAHGLPGINTQIDYPSSGRLLISLVFLACCSTAFPRWKNYFILFFAGQRYRHVGGGRGRRSNAPSMYFLKLSLILCQTEMIQNFIYLQCFDNGTLLVPLKFEQANLTVTEAANVSFFLKNKIFLFVGNLVVSASVTMALKIVSPPTRGVSKPRKPHSNWGVFIPHSRSLAHCTQLRFPV